MTRTGSASLGFLLELALQARSIRGEVERLQDHEDRDIALRARDLIAAMDAGAGASSVQLAIAPDGHWIHFAAR